MNFTLHQLRIYCLVVDLKSITRAAEELNMTQPAISIQLKNLQDQFDIPLIEIVGKKIHVTDFGNEFYTQSKEILRHVNEVKYSMDSYKGLLSGKLKISTVSTGKYIMPYYLKPFLDKHPSIDLTLDVSNRKEVLRDLAENKIDFALVSLMPSDLDVSEEILMKNPLCFIGPKQANPTKNNSFTDLPIIYREEGSGTRMAMQRYFEQLDLAPKAKIELTSNEAVKQAIIAGLGYSFVSLVSLKNELKEGEVILYNETKMRIRSQWRLIYSNKRQLSPIAKAFLAFIGEQKQHIYNRHFKWMEEFDDEMKS